jgi:DNA polymerase-3 subunit beta
MRIKIEKRAFVECLGKIHSIVEKRTTIPILANVKIDVDSDSVMMSVTDNDLYVIEKLSPKILNILKTGSATVSAHMLFDITKKLPDDSIIEISFDTDKSTEGMLINSGKMQCYLPSIGSEEFPAFAEIIYDQKITLAAQKLKKLLNTVKYAISQQETRYYLQGVFLQIIQGDGGVSMLRAVATDGHRLALSNAEVDSDNAILANGVIIPKKTVSELIKLIEDFDSDIEICFSKTSMTTTIGGLKLSSKLIDSKFPDYDKILPINNDKVLKTSVDDLGNAINFVTTISSDKARSVRFEIVDKSKLILSVNNSNQGFSKASQELDIDWSFDKMEIVFNGRYILEVLSVIDEAYVYFSILNSNGAVLVRGSEDKLSMHVVMPIQI